MKTFVFLSVILFASALQSCVYLKRLFPEPDFYKFNYSFINKASHYSYFVGQNLSDIDSMKQVAENALAMFGNSTIALSTSDMGTDFTADFTVNIKEGRGVKLSFRTTANDIKTIPGITFNYTDSGSWIEENGQTLARLDTVQAIIGQPERIQITNEGKQYTVQVGCNIVYRGKTNLPATEYIIPSTFSGSSVLLTGMDLITIRRADKRNTPQARAERVRW